MISLFQKEGIFPNIGLGYASSPEESENPELWRGLVGAWAPALGIQGGILQDFSGNGNLGTLVNMDPLTDWVGVNDSRIPGYALEFDASNDIVEIDDDPTISAMNALTLSVWVNPKATSQLSGSRIIAKSDSGTADDYALGYSASATTKIRFRVTTGGQNNLDIADSIPLNTWTHVVGTYDGVIMRVYYGGVEKGTLAANGSIATSNEKLTLASHAATPTNRRFEGQIAEARVYNRALSPEEVLADFINPLAAFRLRNQVFSLVAAPGPGGVDQAVITDYAIGYKKKKMYAGDVG